MAEPTFEFNPENRPPANESVVQFREDLFRGTTGVHAYLIGAWFNARKQILSASELFSPGEVANACAIVGRGIDTLAVQTLAQYFATGAGAFQHLEAAKMFYSHAVARLRQDETTKWPLAEVAVTEFHNPKAVTVSREEQDYWLAAQDHLFATADELAGLHWKQWVRNGADRLKSEVNKFIIRHDWAHEIASYFATWRHGIHQFAIEVGDFLVLDYPTEDFSDGAGLHADLRNRILAEGLKFSYLGEDGYERYRSVLHAHEMDTAGQGLVRLRSPLVLTSAAEMELAHKQGFRIEKEDFYTAVSRFWQITGYSNGLV
jgi:hypothetical protein